MNPFYVLVCTYFSANLYAGLFAISTGEISLDGRVFEFHPQVILMALVVQAGFLFLISALYSFLKDKFHQGSLYLGAWAGLILFFIQISYLFFGLINGLYMAGSEARPENFSLLHVIFIIAQPDILYVVVGVLLSSNRFFWANSVLFLISMVLRGWMAGFMVVFVMVFCRYRSVSKAGLSIAFLLIFFLFVSLPFIVEYKWAARSGGGIDQAIQNVLDFGYVSSLAESASYLADRFQHVGHVALILDNLAEFHNEYNSGAIMSFWLDGMPQTIYMKLIGYEPPWRLNNYIVGEFYNVSDSVWNTHPGLAGWLLVLGDEFFMLFLYLAACFFVPLCWLARYGGERLLLVLSCFSIIYLYHGWIGIYFNMILYSLVIVFISRCRIRF